MKAAKKSEAVTISLPDEIYLLAIDLDRFEWDYDPYGYRDYVGGVKENISYIEGCIKNRDVNHIREILQKAISEYENTGLAHKLGGANALLDRLDNLVELVKSTKGTIDTTMLEV